MGDSERRWSAVLAHRERLLRLARSRVDNPHDAEDCVQEAMLRCVEFARLDEERLGQFLTSVTLRLCADVHRGQARGVKLSRRLTSFVTDDPGPEESVCDRAESVWLSGRLDDLTPRQRAIVEARAEGLSCGAVAERLLVPYTTVESALARVRRSMRGALESTLGLAAPPTWARAARVLAGGVAATAAVVSVAHHVPEAEERRPRPRALAPYDAGDDERQGAGSGRRVRAGTAGGDTLVGTALGATSGAPTTVRPPDLDLAEPVPDADFDADGVQGGVHTRDEYTFEERVAHCVDYGVVVGERYTSCRYPPGDPRNNQEEYAATPSRPEGDPQ